MIVKTRDRMIQTTARHLQERGYYGTSLNDILAESDAPRGSLYFHFPGGKAQIVAEATRVSIDQATEALRQAMAEAPTPGAGVRRFVEVTAELMAESDYTFGCPVAPIILDAQGEEAALAELCRAAFDEWAVVMRAAFEDAGMGPDRAATLALMVEATHEGLFLIARARRDIAPLTTGAVELESLIDDATPTQVARQSGPDGG
jgi:TetR/AcrR family transcriptional regulator, lmrAB and yxaGH operons repressor